MELRIKLQLHILNNIMSSLGEKMNFVRYDKKHVERKNFATFILGRSCFHNSVHFKWGSYKDAICCSSREACTRSAKKTTWQEWSHDFGWLSSTRKYRLLDPLIKRKKNNHHQRCDHRWKWKMKLRNLVSYWFHTIWRSKCRHISSRLDGFEAFDDNGIRSDGEMVN